MKKRVLDLIVVILIILFVSGIENAFNFVKTLLNGTADVFAFILKMAIQFPDMLGVTDYIHTWLFYLLITICFGILGISLSKKQSRKIFSIVSFTVTIVSFILTIITIKQ